MRNSGPYRLPAFLRCPAGPAVPVNLAECISASVKCEASPNYQKPCFFAAAQAFEATHDHERRCRQAHAFQVCSFSFGFLVRLNILCI